MTKIWKPEVFQGRGKKKDYFEGWYFKSVSKDEKIAYAIIAGLSITKNPGNSHAFVMFVDARNTELHYYQYPLSSFWADKEKFEKVMLKLVYRLKVVAQLLEPFMPETAEKIKTALETKKVEPLFQRIK